MYMTRPDFTFHAHYIFVIPGTLFPGARHSVAE
jgi:hypothetical protein